MKIIRYMIVVAALIVPSLTLAYGEHCSGDVEVTPGGYLNSGLYVRGSMNVRWDNTPEIYTGTAPSLEHIAITGYGSPYSTGQVSISARDSQGEYFYCKLDPDNRYYSAARQLLLSGGMQDGTYIRVSKYGGVAFNCTSIWIEQKSCAQH
jgi:hypothetical protein